MSNITVDAALHPNQRRERIFEIALLGLIVLIAFILRFYKLGQWSFWGDEIFTLSLQEDGFNTSVWRQSIASLLIQTMVAVFGSNEWNARLAPAVIGALTIPVLYFPVRRLFGQGVSLIAAALLAVSTWHLYWSQNARFYTLLLLFYTLALLSFLIGFEEDKPAWVLLALLFLGLAAKERLLALFFLPVAGVYLACLALLPIEKPRGLHWKNMALFFGPLLALGLLFAGPYLRDFAGWMRGFGTPNNTPFWLLAGTIFYVGLPVVGLGAWGGGFLLVFGKGAGQKRAVLLLGLAAVLPLVGLMAIASFHYTANRYAFVTLTGWILLAALAVKELIAHLPWNVRSLGVGVLLLLLGSSLVEDVFYFRSQNGNRDDWKGAVGYIAGRLQPGEQVIGNDPALVEYYLKSGSEDFRGLELDQIEQGGRRVWFIEDTNSLELYPQIHAWLSQKAQLAAVYDVHVHAKTYWMRVYLFNP